MAKKKDKLAQAKGGPGSQVRTFRGISNRGWKVIGSGIGIVVIGFIVLSYTDPAGQNWASNLSPFLILGGYATIAVGIILPEAPKDPLQIKNPVQK